MKPSILTILLAACLTGLAGENLLENGDFETGIGGWGNWSPGAAKAEASCERPHGGKRCLVYRHTATTGSGNIVAGFPVKGGETYTYDGWLRGDAGALKAVVYHYDAGGRYCGEAALFGATRLDDWTHFEKAFTVPTNVARTAVGLTVAQGVGCLDDARVRPGNRCGRAANEIVNSSFRFALHDDGMPEFWSSAGAFSFDSFQRGVHDGRFYRTADEVPSPVPGTKAIFVDGIGWTDFRTGALAGGADYTFSVYVKAAGTNDEVTLRLPGFAPNEKKFRVGSDWTRVSLTGHRTMGVARSFPQIRYDRQPFYVAAPMLHEGRVALPWTAHPADASLPDLRAGKQAVVKAVASCAFDVPESAEWADAKRLTDFYCREADQIRTESSKYRALVRRQGGTLHVSVECRNGRKPAVASPADNPLVIGNDAVELFVSSSVKGSPYIQFMGGRNGASAATRGVQGVAFGGGWTYRALETEQGWLAEYALPLALFDKPDGDFWRFNVGITDFDGVKPSFHSAIRGGFHAPREFMKLTGLPRGSKSAELRAAAEFDFYTDEPAVRVIVEGAEGAATATLRGFEGVGKVEKVEKVEGVVAFDISGLPEGYYEVEVKAANGTARTHFRKAPAGTRHSRVNRFKRLFEIDGRPFFPFVFNWLGLNGRLPEPWQIAALKAHHINTIEIMPEMYAEWVRTATPEFRRATMRTFADAGFKFLMWCGGDLSGGFGRFLDVRERFMEEAMEFREHVLCWYYLDEIAPFWEKNYGIGPKDYADGYRRLKAKDPARLHFINWNCSSVREGAKFYMEDDATDFYCLDCYPYCDVINYGALLGFESAARAIGERIERRRLPGMMSLQTYAHQEGFREPMPVEYRNNVFMGLVHGVSGFTNFIGVPDHKDLWDELGRSYGAAERWLEMTARPGSELIRRGREGNVAYALWKNGCGGYALVAANVVYAQQGESLKGLKGLKGLRVEMIGGEGELKVGEDGALEINLPSAGSAAWFVR